MHFLGTQLDSIDDAASDDGIDQEFNDEIDSDDGEYEDEWVCIGSGTDMGDDGGSVIEEAEGCHEENGIEKCGAGTADDGGDDSFLILDSNGIIDDAGEESDKDSGDDTHDNQTAEISCGGYLACIHTALKNQGSCIHSRECLNHGDSTPDESGKCSHPGTEHDSDDTDWDSHQRDGQDRSLNGSKRSEAKDEHDGNHDGGYG